MKDKPVGLHELYAKDPVAADRQIWGRTVNPITRRGFLSKSSMLAMSAVLGAAIPFAHKMPGGLIPAALADDNQPFTIAGKEGLRVLNDHPINAETPAHLLDDDFTPAAHFFIRNNGVPPALETIGDPDEWTLSISGESCETPTNFTVAELKQRFEHYTYALTLECGGNGRSEFNPPAKGKSVDHRGRRLRQMDRRPA